MNKINIKKFLANAATAGLLLANAAGAFAAGPGYNPPPAVLDVCNAGHGAFAAFSDPDSHWTPGQPPYFGDNELGSARAGVTGVNNSGFSASCNL